MTTMEMAAFYHLWPDGDWQVPLKQFQEALRGFDGEQHYGIHGLSPGRVTEAQLALSAHNVTSLTGLPHRYEAFTLNLAREYAAGHEGYVLYAHGKGSSESSVGKTRWRNAMTELVVRRWPTNLSLLERVQAVGCHWVTEEQYLPYFLDEWRPAPGCGYFAGNFWIARCDYLRGLPRCEYESRYDAERWLGLGHPAIHDLRPGWPHY